MNYHNGKRIQFIDSFRGFAVLWMIFFHFCFDLKYFGFLSIPAESMFWFIQPRVIVPLFYITFGTSLVIAFKRNISTKKYFGHLLKIGLAAALVSIVTFVTIPENWIFFGTLHCLFVMGFIAFPLIARPRLSLSIALLVLILQLTPWTIPWPVLSNKSVDYITPTPWGAFVLIGIFVGHYFADYMRSWPTNKFLETLGKNALIIYILHQILIFGSLYALYFFINHH